MTFLVVGAIYLALCLPISELSHRIERKVHVHRQSGVGP